MRALEEFDAESETLSEFENFIVHLNFEYYGIFGKSTYGDDHLNHALASYWPKNWVATYSNKKYASQDPAFRYLAVCSQGFRWSETLDIYALDPNIKKMARIMAEAARFGMEEGYTFPVFNRNGLAGYVCVAGRTQVLSPSEINLLDAVAKRILAKLQRSSQELGAGSPVNVVNGVAVTRRELQTLKCIAEGMTSNDISKLMEISNHTVDWYMNGLQEKLNARNRQHAVAIALRTGLIS
jgi:LuxR family transcriptional regulator